MAENGEFKTAICCGTCPFWAEPREEPDIANEIGNCHEGSVKHVFILPSGQNIAGHPTYSYYTKFPPVNRNEWCGKHPAFSAERRPQAIDERLTGEVAGSG